MDHSDSTKKMTEIDFENYVEEGNEFIVYKTRFGLYSSRDKEGNGICSSVNKEACIFWSREHFNGMKNSYKVVTKTRFEGRDVLK